MDRRYWPRQFDEIEGTPQTWLNEPVPPDNVAMLVPHKRRSLHAIVAQNLADVEDLIARLDFGAGVAASGRALIRDLYVQSRKQRDLLAAALRLELE
jgi:hypothetical protein